MFAVPAQKVMISYPSRMSWARDRCSSWLTISMPSAWAASSALKCLLQTPQAFEKSRTWSKSFGVVLTEWVVLGVEGGEALHTDSVEVEVDVGACGL